MSDTSLKHFVAFTATAVCALAYLAGYFSAPLGWWWTVFTLVVVYGGIYALVNK